MPVFNQSRSNIIRLIFAGMFLIIIAQLFHLQLISAKYKRQAQENALFRKSIYPTRGIIYDRKGRAILNNTILYDLMVTPGQVRPAGREYLEISGLQSPGTPRQDLSLQRGGAYHGLCRRGGFRDPQKIQ